MRAIRARATALLVLAGGLVLGGALAAAQPVPATTILHTDLDDEAITPVIERFLTRGLARAADEGHQAFLIELDTPGGLDTSTRDIVETFLDADVPTIVYVPQGGRAASAGAIIGFSAHVLAMAPATSIGAATPIGGRGGRRPRAQDRERGGFVRRRGRARAWAQRRVRARDGDGRPRGRRGGGAPHRCDRPGRP